MDERGDLVPRLQALFGSVWQAALDHAGVLSRRRARDIGAGGSPSDALQALIEMLETTPISAWPARWWGLGKAPETCPILTLFPEYLLDRRIRPQDAVLVWDLCFQPSGPPQCANVAVGYFPRTSFTGLPRDDAARTRWRLWHNQWDECHGATASGWMERPDETLESMLAAWIARGSIGGRELERVNDMLSARIIGFSRQRVLELADQRREQEAQAVL